MMSGVSGLAAGFPFAFALSASRSLLACQAVGRGWFGGVGGVLLPPCQLLLQIRDLLFGVCDLLFGVCDLLFGVCDLLSAFSDLLFAFSDLFLAFGYSTAEF